MVQNSQDNILINNSRTDWPTLISMPFLNSLDTYYNLDAHVIFQKGIDNFEIEHKTC